MPQPDRVADVFVGVSAVLGLVMMGFGLGQPWSFHFGVPAQLARGTPIKAEVTLVGSTVAMYQYLVAGKTMAGQTTPGKLKTGDSLCVVYNPERPHRSTVFDADVYRIG